MLVSPIEPSSARGEFIREVSLIIWDEASMANRATLDCVDNVCRRIMYNDQPFGSKIVVLLGDFRQTCPVIRKGSRAQVVNACIQKSPVWQEFVIRKLLHPIRNAEDPWFSAYVNNIGDGAGPEIPLDMLDTTTSASELTAFVFPSHILNQPLECLKRAILAPTHAQVDSYNNEILSRVDGISRTYFAADSLKEIDATGIQSPNATLDYVARQNPQGLPNHSLTVKTNGIYRLLRNFSLDRGLVKNVRVVVTGVGVRIISVKIIRDQSSHDAQDEDEILIPRITFTHVLNNGYTLLRRQFPLAPAYATTFNSCQGLNLDYVGVDLTKPVFSHGQLYTALSRIKNRTRAKIRLRPGEKSTTNVTYHEILLR
jgi:ATP-dependent DNA helicase PIF1